MGGRDGPDDTWLASGGEDGTVRIWDPGTASAPPWTVPTQDRPHRPPPWVAGSLAIGLGAGILVIKPRAAGWP